MNIPKLVAECVEGVQLSGWGTVTGYIACQGQRPSVRAGLGAGVAAAVEEAGRGSVVLCGSCEGKGCQ